MGRGCSLKRNHLSRPAEGLTTRGCLRQQEPARTVWGWIPFSEPNSCHLRISVHADMLSRLASNFPRHVVPVPRRAISVQVAASPPRARPRALIVSAVRAQSILHGSREAKETESEMQHHSIARGKYLHGIESASRQHAQIAMLGTQYCVTFSPSSQARQCKRV